MQRVKLREGLKPCNYCKQIIFSDEVVCSCSCCKSDPRSIKVPEIDQNAIYSLKRLNTLGKLSKNESKVIERLRFTKSLDIYLFDPKTIRFSFIKNIESK